MSPTQTTVFTITFVYGIIGMSLLILSGWAGQISLGQFAFAGGGGYVAAMLSAHAHLPLIACVIVAALAGSVMAVLVGLPALKMRGLHLAITTLAVALTTSSILLSPSHLGRYLPDTVSRGTLIGIDLKSQRAFYFFSLSLLVLIVFATMGLRRSRSSRRATTNLRLRRSVRISCVRASPRSRSRARSLRWRAPCTCSIRTV
jgi:branched-chain amino acid transport system permease protein